MPSAEAGMGGATGWYGGRLVNPPHPQRHVEAVLEVVARDAPATLGEHLRIAVIAPGLTIPAPGRSTQFRPTVSQ